MLIQHNNKIIFMVAIGPKVSFASNRIGLVRPYQHQSPRKNSAKLHGTLKVR